MGNKLIFIDLRTLSSDLSWRSVNDRQPAAFVWLRLKFVCVISAIEHLQHVLRRGDFKPHGDVIPRREITFSLRN